MEKTKSEELKLNTDDGQSEEKSEIAIPSIQVEKISLDEKKNLEEFKFPDNDDLKNKKEEKEELKKEKEELKKEKKELKNEKKEVQKRTFRSNRFENFDNKEKVISSSIVEGTFKKESKSNSIIRDFYKNKVIFLTGVTGFLGKALLEKILYDIPDVKQIIILIRDSKKHSGRERFANEIVTSPIMDRLKEVHGANFRNWIMSKVTTVCGEISSVVSACKDVYDDINIIIHSAATVGFLNSIDFAIKTNVYGTLEVLELAKKCKNLVCFCHISTCYVNFPTMDFVEEKLYEKKLPGNEDLFEFCKRVCKLKPKEMKKIESKYLKELEFPNTYTFTKWMTEQIIKKLKPKDMNLIILRPSVIGCSYKEPYIGWLDSITAATSVYFASGLGVLRISPGHEKIMGDVVPVDFVVNAILLVMPKRLEKKKIDEPGIFDVFHSSCGSKWPCIWRDSTYTMVWYFCTHLPKKSLTTPRFQFVNDPWQYKYLFFLEYTLPAKLYEIFAKIVPTKLHKKNAKGLKMLESKAHKIGKSFSLFCSDDCIFDTRKIDSLYEELPQNSEEREIFRIGKKFINWKMYFQSYLYGISKWILKEDIYNPTETNLIKTDFLSRGHFEKTIANQLLIREKVKISKSIHELLSNHTLSKEKVNEIIEREVLKGCYFDRSSDYIIRAIGFSIMKYYKYNFSSVNVDENTITHVKEISKSGSPVIYLCPLESSNDFLLMLYVCYLYSYYIPCTITHDLLSPSCKTNQFVNYSLKNLGSLLVDKNKKHPLLNYAILQEYIIHILNSQQSIQCFFRSDSYFRNVIKVLVEGYVNGRLRNVTIVPFNIVKSSNKDWRLGINQIISIEGILKDNTEDVERLTDLIMKEVKTTWSQRDRKIFSPEFFINSKL